MHTETLVEDINTKIGIQKAPKEFPDGLSEPAKEIYAKLRDAMNDFEQTRWESILKSGAGVATEAEDIEFRKMDKARGDVIDDIKGKLGPDLKPSDVMNRILDEALKYSKNYEGIIKSSLEYKIQKIYQDWYALKAGKDTELYTWEDRGRLSLPKEDRIKAINEDIHEIKEQYKDLLPGAEIEAISNNALSKEDIERMVN